MSGSGFFGIAAASLLAMSLGSTPTAASSDPLAAYAWKARVLLVVASKADDPKLAEQRKSYEAMGEEAKSRNLVLVEAVGQTAQAAALRKRFGLDAAGFHALLIGKDGGNKLASDDPLGAKALFLLIDSMPMRQREMRQGS